MSSGPSARDVARLVLRRVDGSDASLSADSRIYPPKTAGVARADQNLAKVDFGFIATWMTNQVGDIFTVEDL